MVISIGQALESSTLECKVSAFLCSDAVFVFKIKDFSFGRIIILSLFVCKWKIWSPRKDFCCIAEDWIIEKHHLILNWIFPVHGVEYSFGAHDYPSSGVFEVEPRECPGFRFRRSIFIGTTDMDPIQVREFMERQSAYYRGDTYHLVMKNCNHFSEDMCYRLTGNRIPKWVNRLARIGSLIFYYYLFCMLPNWISSETGVHRNSIQKLAEIWDIISVCVIDYSFFITGSFCKCILPDALKTSAIGHGENFEGYESDKRRLKSSFNCLSSISMRQREKEVSISSLFLQSHYKDCCLPHGS